MSEINFLIFKFKFKLHQVLTITIFIAILPLRSFAFCEFFLKKEGDQTEVDKEVKSSFDPSLDFVEAKIRLLENLKEKSNSDCKFTITSKSTVIKEYLKSSDECQRIKIRLKKQMEYKCKYALISKKENDTLPETFSNPK